MKIGIIGSGIVGQTVGAALAAKGHDVRLGIRAVNDAELDKARNQAETLRAWTARTGVPVVSFAQAAAHGEIAVNATGGGVALEALKLAGADNLAGKVLIDISNPLDFSTGTLTALPDLTNTTSVGEEVQKAFPQVRVVKTLNTAWIGLGVDASLVKGDIDMFVAGNDPAAKETVTTLLQRDFGWRSVIDLGDIAGARGTEQFLTLWFRLYQQFGSGAFGIKIVR
jgi:predicted dinucleotide-binding enzyme